MQLPRHSKTTLSPSTGDARTSARNGVCGRYSVAHGSLGALLPAAHMSDALRAFAFNVEPHVAPTRVICTE